MTGLWVMEALAGWLENLIGFLFVSDIVGVERKKYGHISILAAGMTAGLWVINRVELLSVLAVFYEIIGMTWISYLWYRKKMAGILVSVGSFFLILYSLDFLLIVVVGIMSGNRDYGLKIVQSQSWDRFLLVVVAKAVLILLYVIFHSQLKKISVPFRKMLPGVAIAVILSFAFLQKVCTEINADIAGIGLMFFLVMAMGGSLVVQYTKVKGRQLQMELLEERGRVMADGYHTMLKNYNQSQAYYHDLRNHLLTIENYLMGGSYEKAAAYASSLRSSYQEIGRHVFTGIAIIDFVLSCKKAAAEEKNIRFQIEADRVNEKVQDISETDLCALLGNVLDNAIEGCERVGEIGANREIQVLIKNIQETVMIKVANTCEGQELPEREERLLPRTLKKESWLHGWGMRSMEMIMEKNKGTMTYNCRDGWFEVVVVFFF